MPSGTVTFLFTDIEGSTRLWEGASDAMREALERHDAIVRGAIAACDGQVFSTGGDGFAAAFARAGDAIGAAVAAQRLLAAEPWDERAQIRVRMGVHTGEAVERDGDYFGPAVNRAARVMGAAPGGQIIVSAVTAELARGVQGVAFTELGPHRLRGVTEPVRILRVTAEGLDDTPMPLLTQEAVTGNLPRPITELVGRAEEVKHVVAEVGRRRLVTLTGTGGVGKTRLAIEAAWLAAAEFPDGLWLVDLAAVSDPAAVVFATATTLGVPPAAGLTMEQAIVDALAGRRALVVLDNCEHLIDASSALTQRLLAGCPAATVLATSREPLGLVGERVHVVASLDPALEGVELFCERATAADDTSVYSDDDIGVIADICDRLDGIPLAIELAAARARTMTPGDIRSRLDDRFRVLRGGARGGIERHQTLRAAVAWSYQLLTEEERRVFECVSVFAGGFDLRAAAAVCRGAGADEHDIAEVLASLVDKSMIATDRTSGSVRYRALETLRQYGEEALAERDAAVAARNRHLAHFLAVADGTSAAYATAGQLEAIRTARREWDNFRAAFEWAKGSGDVKQAVRLCWALGAAAPVLQQSEHRDWVTEVANAAPPGDGTLPSLLPIQALWAMMAGEHDQAIRFAQMGLALGPVGIEPLAVILCSLSLALAHAATGCLAEGLDDLAAAEPLASSDPALLGSWLQAAMSITAGSDQALSRRYNARLAEVATTLGTELWLAVARVGDGYDLLFTGRPREALEPFFEVIRLCDGLPCPAHVAALIGIVGAAAELSEYGILTGALRDLYDTHAWFQLWVALDYVGVHWIECGQLEPGAAILGHLEAHGRVASPIMARRLAAMDVLRAHPELHETRRAGARMTREQLVAYALGHLAAT